MLGENNMFYFARRTNYDNYDFSNENWVEMSEQELWQEMYNCSSSNFGKESGANKLMEEAKNNPNSVVMGGAGRLFMFTA